MSLKQRKQCLMHFHSQRPFSFWSATRFATSGKVQHWKSAINRLPVTLYMLRVKSGKSDWLVVRNEFSAHAQTSDPAKGRPKATQPLEMRKKTLQPIFTRLTLCPNFLPLNDMTSFIAHLPFTPHPLPSWAGSRDQIIHQGQNIVLIDLEILRTNIKWNVWDSVRRTETYWYLRMLSSVFYFIHRKMSPAACQHKAWFQGVSRYVLRAQSLWLS